jgi:outer membrane protein
VNVAVPRREGEEGMRAGKRKGFRMRFAWMFLFFWLTPTSSLIAQQGTASLTMEGVIDRALERNNLVRSSRFGVEKARWDEKKARMALLPTVNFSARMMRIDDRTFAERDFRRYFGPELADQIPQTVFQTSYASSLDLTVPIFNAELLNGISLARAGGEVANRGERMAREQLLFQVAIGYLNVLKAREVLQLQRDYLELTRLNLEKAERLHRADRYSRVEALRWQVEYKQQESAVVGSRAMLRTAVTALGRLLGAEKGEKIEIEERIPERLLAFSNGLGELDDGELLELGQVDDGALIEGNAGLAANRAGAEMSRLSHRQAKAAYLPNLSLSYSHAWRENNTLALDDYSPKTLMVVLQVPVFSGMQNYTSVRSAYYEYRQEQEELADQVQNVRFLLGDVASRLVDLKAQRQLARANVELSEESYRIVERQKEQGRVSNIDFIDAKLNLQNAKLGEVTAGYDFIAAAVELKYLLGELESILK